MKICALIPSFNESGTIGLLVRNVKLVGLDVVVVDDGSVDRTAEIARDSGAKVLRHKQNKGKGASLKEAFCYALEKGYDAVITMDADGQHSPGDISKFIDAAERADVDIIVGNRMSSSKNMPPVRWLTNKFMSFVISKICRQGIPDSQCGFRLFKKEALKALDLTSANYEIESEALIEACRKNLKIKFIPIQTIYAQQISRINPIVDTIRFFRYILNLSVKKK